MIIYQIGDWIKEVVHLGKGFMGFGILSFFQTDQIAPSVPSKLIPVSNNFFNHKISFWKKKNRIDMILFCAYIIELQSCDLVTCVGLELCSRLLQTWIFLKMFLKDIEKVLKREALEWSYVARRNFVLTIFSFLSNQIVKMGKLFASNGSYLN